MQEILLELEKVKAQLESLEKDIAELAEREAKLREEIAKSLSASGIKSQYTPNGTYLVTLSNTAKVSVTDEVSVKEFLQTRGLLEECLKLDLTTVKSLHKREAIPGITESTREVLSVRSAKKETVEKAVPEETPAQFRERLRSERGA